MGAMLDIVVLAARKHGWNETIFYDFTIVCA